MKSFIALCLRRPVSVAAFYILLVVLAGVAWVRLPVALLPDLGYPALAVWTAYPDVPPRRVEESVTEPVEEAVAGTEGLQRVTARSLLGGSLVELRFGWNTNLNRALLEVREALDRLGEALPEAAERPVVLRLDPSERPIMLVALRRAGVADTSDDAAPVFAEAVQRTATPQALIDLKRLGREVIARRLEQLGGVARVRVTGGYERIVEIRLDADRLAAYGVGIDQIRQSLRAANVALPGGVIRRGPFRYAVEVSGEFDTPGDVAQTVITPPGRAPLRLADMAEVEASTQERRGLVRLDGRETLLLLIERASDANTVRAAEAMREVLRVLEAELPGIRLDVVVDESRFVEAAIGGIARAVLLGGLLAVVVLFVFLRHPRALSAVAVGVPLSLAITLVLFDLLGITFNLISLSGLALGVGMLVDNAIVVVENIARLREEGFSRMEAARRGTAEVGGAITASTLTTAAVFLPLMFVEGLAGRLFRDQSLAVVASLLASLLVALTAVPLIASRGRGEPEGEETAPEKKTPAWLARYERGLSWCLDRRAAVLVGCTLLLLGGGLLAWHLPREVIPSADQGRVRVHFVLPPGADLSLVSRCSAALEAAVRRRGLARHVLADVGMRDEARLELDPRPPYAGDLILLLPEGAEVQAVAQKVEALPVPEPMTLEARPAETQLEALLAGGEADLVIDLVGETRAEAEAVIGRVLAALQEHPELVNVRRAEAQRVPAYRLTFRRTNLARFGVDPSVLGTYLEAVARGARVAALRTVSEEIPIILRTREVRSIEELLALHVPTAGGERLPLKTFVRAERTLLPAALIRSGQAPVVRLLADVAAEADLAAATEAAEEVFAAVLSGGVRAEVGGARAAFQRSLQAVLWSLLLSLLLVYLILAAEFESLTQPFINMATVLLAALGVALVLWLTGQSVNLMSLTGCVVLVGIVDNNAVIQVDLINQRRAAGMGLREAVLSGSRDRVRPILMTTITTVLGMLPLALGFGAGAELRAPLAIAIVGGLTSATVLTLFVVPVLYTLAARGR